MRLLRRERAADYRGVSVESGEQLARRLLLQCRVDLLEPELCLIGAAGVQDLGHAVRASLALVWGATHRSIGSTCRLRTLLLSLTSKPQARLVSCIAGFRIWCFQVSLPTCTLDS